MQKIDVFNPYGKALIQFIKFGLTGVLNTLIDFGVYLLLTRAVALFALHIFIAKAISFICAATFSYFANRRWTFKKRGPHQAKEVILFYSTVGSAIFINVGIHYLVVEMLHLSDIIGIILAAGFTAVWGFLFSKFIVFKETK